MNIVLIIAKTFQIFWLGVGTELQGIVQACAASRLDIKAHAIGGLGTVATEAHNFGTGRRTELNNHGDVRGSSDEIDKDDSSGLADQDSAWGAETTPLQGVKDSGSKAQGLEEGLGADDVVAEAQGFGGDAQGQGDQLGQVQDGNAEFLADRGFDFGLTGV